MIKGITVLIALMVTLFTMSQENTFWVTVQQNDALKTLQRQYPQMTAKKAVPASKKEDLQKVYAITANDITAVFASADRMDGLENPVMIEPFELLYTTNDFSAQFSNDYSLKNINAKAAWDITKGSPGVRIGILDTYFDTLQEDLQSKIAANHATPNSNVNHGTAVAITAAGHTDNGVGKSAIGFNSSLALYSMNYNAMLNATYSGIRVINVSWSSGCSPNGYYQAIIDEVVANGTAIIAAAGNGSTCGGPSNLVYPAAFNNVIAVSSVNANDNHEAVQNDPTSTHQHNSSVDLVAPGYNIPLAIANNQYVHGSGTSFAAPLVSGTIGLMLDVNPCLTPAAIENILLSTADNVDSINPQYAGQLGAGRLDAAAAVQMAKDTHPIQPVVQKFESLCNNSFQGISVSLDSGNLNAHSIQWSDGSNAWNRYNLQSGNYSYTIHAPDGCTYHDTVSFMKQGPEFDYNSSVIINDSNDELVDMNNDGIINIKGVLVIEPGVNFNLENQTLHFAPNADLQRAGYPASGIVVEHGAKLDLNNVITDKVEACGFSEWGGIEVVSNNKNESGELYMENSLIKNAKMGVANLHKATVGQPATFGGYVHIQSTDFINNKTSIYLQDYRASQINHVISNNFFSYDRPISDVRHIEMHDAMTIIEKNVFKGNTEMNNSNRGMGVRAVNSFWKTSKTKPETVDTYNNEFHNLSVGIDIDGTKENTMEINNDYFFNNQVGLSAQSTEGVAIVNSVFHLAAGTYTATSVGIDQNENEGMTIKDNMFTSDESGTFNVGIRANGGDAEAMTIKRNTFGGTIANGIVFSGTNHMEEFACNNFSLNGNADVAVREDQNTAAVLSIEGGLLLNAFSACGNVNTNIEANDLAGIWNYTDAQDYTPMCVAGNVQITNENITVDREKACEDREGRGQMIEMPNEAIAQLIEENDDQVSVFPNPSNGDFQINVPANYADKITISSMSGQVISEHSTQSVMNFQQSDLARGVYMVAFSKQGEQVSQRRVVVQ
ncbi:MAG: S8 family serine peptidase [Bacteroidota bacterium]